MSTVFTIGHSNQSSEDFIALLIKQRIEQVLDVRSTPYSSYVPHFNRESITHRLARKGIEYLYLGDQLGGKPKSDEFYENGHVVYERVAELSQFRRGLDRVVDESEQRRLVLMCAEENPVECHRHPLLASALLERGVRVLHLRRDGSLQDAAAMTEPTSPQLPLFEEEGEDLTWQSPKRVRRRDRT